MEHLICKMQPPAGSAPSPPPPPPPPPPLPASRAAPTGFPCPRTEPVQHWGERCGIVVENVPIVLEIKIPKLRECLKRVFAECGKGINANIKNVDLLTDPCTGATLGCAFIEFTHIECVKEAVMYGDGFLFGKNALKVHANELSSAMSKASYTDHLTRRRLDWPQNHDALLLSGTEAADEIMRIRNFIARMRTSVERSLQQRIRPQRPQPLPPYLKCAVLADPGGMSVGAAVRVCVHISMSRLIEGLVTTSAIFQHADHRYKYAEAIIARVITGYCKRIQV
jgi:hypothetical protein